MDALMELSYFGLIAHMIVASFCAVGYTVVLMLLVKGISGLVKKLTAK